MFSYTIVFIYLTAISLRLANSCITTRLQTKMPKLKTLDQFIKQRNVKNFPSLPPHPFLENINHLINQQQANATNTQKLTQGPQDMFKNMLTIYKCLNRQLDQRRNRWFPIYRQKWSKIQWSHRQHTYLNN